MRWLHQQQHLLQQPQLQPEPQHPPPLQEEQLRPAPQLSVHPPFPHPDRRPPPLQPATQQPPHSHAWPLSLGQDPSPNPPAQRRLYLDEFDPSALRASSAAASAAGPAALSPPPHAKAATAGAAEGGGVLRLSPSGAAAAAAASAALQRVSEWGRPDAGLSGATKVGVGAGGAVTRT